MLTITIETGGAAYRDCDDNLDRYGYEVRRNLQYIADRISCGKQEGKVMDINGNAVGKWEYKED